MSYTIPAGSPKKAHAERFAVELQRALKARGVSLKALNTALGGTSQTKLWHYKFARILPRLSTAIEISEALQWPRLAEIVREARSKPCHQCGRMFVMEGGSANKRYCSDKCRNGALRLRAHLGQAENAEDAPERRLVARLKAELDRVHGSSARAISRLEVRDAIRDFETTSPHSRKRRLQNQADRHISAVEAFCNGCEPEGICRDSECALRAVSPLPLGAVRDVELAVKPPGRWGHPGAREAWAEDMRRRHAENPGWAAETSRRGRETWASLPPEERRERIAKIFATRDGKLPAGYEDLAPKLLGKPGPKGDGESVHRVLAVREAAMRAKALPYRERGLELKAIADRFGISKRTVDRYVSIEEINVETRGEYQAAFAVWPDRPPTQLTAWEPIATARVAS